jgi:hypothetical protein
MTAFLPKQVLLIRHAEKTGSPGDSGLSRRGRARALALVGALPAQYGDPDVIVACANVPKSTRPVDTVRPLADRLRLPIEDRWNTQDHQALAQALQTSRAFTDRRVLVCWRHETLPALARALGFPAPIWPRTDYETVWVIEFLPTPIFRVERQDIELRAPYELRPPLSSSGEPR